MTIAEFFHMGGYGAYVWSAMGVVIFLLLIEPVLLIMQRKSILKSIRRIKRLEQRTNERV